MVTLAYGIFGLCFLVFFSIANAKYYHSQLKYFNVKDYGAVADDKRDNSEVCVSCLYRSSVFDFKPLILLRCFCYRRF